MPSFMTVQIRKDCEHEGIEYKKGQSITVEEEKAKDLMRQGVGVITGNRTVSSEKAVLKPLETRDSNE